MKIFLVGSTGIVGRILIPLLADQGHEIIAIIRDPQKSLLVHDLGAKPFVANVFVREGMIVAAKNSGAHRYVGQGFCG